MPRAVSTRLAKGTGWIRVPASGTLREEWVWVVSSLQQCSAARRDKPTSTACSILFVRDRPAVHSVEP